MSAPRHLRRRHVQRLAARMSRRRFLLVAPVVAAPLALTGCGGGAVDEASTPVAQSALPDGSTRRSATALQGARAAFLHGIATGDPTDKAIIFWTRITTPSPTSVTVRLEVFSDPQARQLVVRTDHTTTADRDFTVKIDQGGLQPATTYYYRFICEGTVSVMGRTRTAPGANSDASKAVRFGVVSCSSIPHGFFNAYRFMGQRHDLDAIIHLGDYIYEYANGAYGNVRTVLPAHEIVSLDDYRTRHAFYKQDPDLMELHRQFPFITIWDDHESTDNAYEEGTTGNTGVPNEPFQPRIAAARRAYDEWMPIRLPDPEGEGNKRIHRKISYGPQADLFMTDTRLYARDRQLSTPIGAGGPQEIEERNNPNRELLGGDQMEFLVNGMEDSKARWKIWCNQVVFHQWITAPGLKQLGGPVGLNGDSWDAYAAERQRIIDRIKGDGFNTQGIDNVVILTGDVHSMWVADITDDPNNPLAYQPTAFNIAGDTQRQYAGAVATEFVVQSVTSPGLPAPREAQTLYDAALRLTTNPHIKHVDLDIRGYAIVTAKSSAFSVDYFEVSTIIERGGTQRFVRGFDVLDRGNRVSSIRNKPLVEGPPRIPVRVPIGSA